MEMMLRARVLTFLLGLCAILNLFLFFYPFIFLGPKLIHAAFFSYSLFGFLVFKWILKISKTNPIKADALFIKCIFAYWGIPVIFVYIIISMSIFKVDLNII
jgi:hypothetical protein